MAASIMPADVMPVAAASKADVYATGESLSSSAGTSPTISSVSGAATSAQAIAL